MSPTLRTAVTALLTVYFSINSLQAEVTKSTLMVTMRDGIELSTDVYRDSSSNKQPVILIRTPYNKAGLENIAPQFAKAGYVLVIQDCRGRFESGGIFIAYNNEGQDGFDTIEWVTKQSWSNRQVGMWGASYYGATQWQAAAERPPGLKVITPTATWTEFYGNIYQGGAVRLSMLTTWAARMSQPPGEQLPTDWSRIFKTLPLSSVDDEIGWSIPWFENMLTHPKPDGFWHRLALSKEVVELDLAVQHTVGYYDFFSREAVRSFNLMQQHATHEHVRNKQQLILGPWDHGSIGRSKVGDWDFGETAIWDRTNANIKWLDRYLKPPNPEAEKPWYPVRYFSMGDNQWFNAKSWPPAVTMDRSFFLNSTGAANTDSGTGTISTRRPARNQPADRFISDPANPTPAYPANDTRPIDGVSWGPVDQRTIGSRDDVLVYSSGVLDKPLRFAGNPTAKLFVSASTADADWVVKLVNVHPSGFAQNIAVGVLRGRFRESLLEPTLLKPGKVYQIEVDLGPVAATIEKGHELRVDISGAHFPLFDRNPNTGKGPNDGSSNKSAERVYHTRSLPSAIVLPIIE
ncbi:MAG: CocE/NonD family hydrolase [Planctomycetaceae bacterium]|nr:CocE/NonD family hydrolase [Planctomycetaceae bacterium]MBT5885095.1 CocE/NonD family hydrolase [Planctomycetaceae bacterium]MBT6849397.1 CocE/NonD family hydrolase [Planctomycetaceae bacterium]